MRRPTYAIDKRTAPCASNRKTRPWRVYSVMRSGVYCYRCSFATEEQAKLWVQQMTIRDNMETTK
jgi:hypothetical protein